VPHHTLYEDLQLRSALPLSLLMSCERRKEEGSLVVNRVSVTSKLVYDGAGRTGERRRVFGPSGPSCTSSVCVVYHISLPCTSPTNGRVAPALTQTRSSTFIVREGCDGRVGRTLFTHCAGPVQT
jgi:hypothetical protein